MKRNEFEKWCNSQSIEVLDIKSIPHGEQLKLQRGQEQLKISFYTTGKTLVQGKSSDLKALVDQIIGTSESSSTKKKEAPSIDHMAQIWIGSDESGKGDFFGPLVVASCLVDKETTKFLEEHGVQDSKKLSDQKILKIYPVIQEELTFFYKVLLPKEYNKEYAQRNNLNLLLAYFHGECIRKLIRSHEVELIIVDQFAKDKALIETAIGNYHPKPKVLQVPKAERDIAVAAASIIARYHFIQSLKELGLKYNTNFEKGAGLGVDIQAQSFKDTYGEEELNQVAKTHFKTMGKLT